VLPLVPEFNGLTSASKQAKEKVDEASKKLKKAEDDEKR